MVTEILFSDFVVRLRSNLEIKQALEISRQNWTASQDLAKSPREAEQAALLVVDTIRKELLSRSEASADIEKELKRSRQDLEWEREDSTRKEERSQRELVDLRALLAQRTHYVTHIVQLEAELHEQASKVYICTQQLCVA